MKIRKGFVSNSSSSSFLCEICGAMESGYDTCASELGFANLPCGHTICESEILSLSDDEFAKFVEDELKQYETKKTESQYSVNCFKKLGGLDVFEIDKLPIKDKYYKLTRKKYIKEQCPICTNKVVLEKDF